MRSQAKQFLHSYVGRKQILQPITACYMLNLNSIQHISALSLSPSLSLSTSIYSCLSYFCSMPPFSAPLPVEDPPSASPSWCSEPGEPRKRNHCLHCATKEPVTIWQAIAWCHVTIRDGLLCYLSIIFASGPKPKAGTSPTNPVDNTYYMNIHKLYVYSYG